MSGAKLSARAQRDLDGICAYIAADNPEAAQSVRRRILATVDFLARYPEVGRRIRRASPRHAQTRWFVVPKYRNYLIFYCPVLDTIMVLRILHAAQDWTRFFPR